MLPKPLGNYGKNARQVKHGNNPKVRSTCAQGLLPGSSGRELEDCVKYETVGDQDEQNIEHYGGEEDRYAIPNIDANVSTGKPRNSHVFTVSVRQHIAMAERQAFHQEHIREDHTETSQDHSQADPNNYHMTEHYAVVEWVTDGHIAVKCHGQQNPRLSNEGSMDEEDLSDTAIEGNCSGMKPKYGQSLGHSSSRQDEVSRSQHAEEEVHGLMETAFSDDYKDENDVSKKCHQVGNEEGERDPQVLLFQARNAQQNEDRMAGSCVVKRCHAHPSSPVH